MSTIVRRVGTMNISVEWCDGGPMTVYRDIERFQFIESGGFPPPPAPGVLYLNPQMVRSVRVEALADGQVEGVA